jgi:hypothetical protein
MDFNKKLKNIKIDVVLGAIFIQNRNINFHYTPVKNATSVSNYFGGLQSSYEPDSKEYRQLEVELCRIAWNVLNIVKNRDINNFELDS